MLCHTLRVFENLSDLNLSSTDKFWRYMETGLSNCLSMNLRSLRKRKCQKWYRQSDWKAQGIWDGCIWRNARCSSLTLPRDIGLCWRRFMWSSVKGDCGNLLWEDWIPRWHILNFRDITTSESRGLITWRACRESTCTRPEGRRSKTQVNRVELVLVVPVGDILDCNSHIVVSRILPQIDI
jgi:hypothetical protein